MRAPSKSLLLTLRIAPDLAAALTREARRRSTTKSEVAREILNARLVGRLEPNVAEEARRQSQVVSHRRSEKQALQFLESAADIDGWT